MAILIAEPDEPEAQRMIEGLCAAGFTCARVETGPQAMARAAWPKDRPGRHSPNALDAQVRRLRAKVDDPFDRPLLHTLRGQGLLLEAPQPSSSTLA